MGDWNVGVVLPVVGTVISFVVGAAVTLHVQKMARSASEARLDKDAKARRLEAWLTEFGSMTSLFIAHVRGMHDLHLHAEHRKPFSEPYHSGPQLTPEAIRWSDAYFVVNRDLFQTKAKLDIMCAVFPFDTADFSKALTNAETNSKDVDVKKVNGYCDQVIEASKSIYDRLNESLNR